MPTTDTLIASARTAVFVFLTGFITGLVGWLNDVVGYLNDAEAATFPDPNVLKVTLFSALAAAAVGFLNGLGIVVQNRFRLGRTPEYTPATTEPSTVHRH